MPIPVGSPCGPLPSVNGSRQQPNPGVFVPLPRFAQIARSSSTQRSPHRPYRNLLSAKAAAHSYRDYMESVTVTTGNKPIYNLK